MIRKRETSITPAPALAQKCLAECIGTAFLVFVGCGTFVVSGYLERSKGTFTMADLLSIAVAFGLAVCIMVYAIGHISGCHINPAVSFALACFKRMPWSEAGAYIVAQLVGGIVGALLLPVVFGRSSAVVIGYDATDYNTLFVNYVTAIVAEAIGTFFILFVIMGTVIDKRAPAGWAGFAIGFTVTVGILVFGTVTGGSFNPARTFGPTVVEMALGATYPFWHVFVYFIGPIIGAIAGVFVYEYLGRLHAVTRRLPGHFERGD